MSIDEPLIDVWHRWRLRRAETDFIIALGKLESMNESWCQWTKEMAEAEKVIASGRMAYHRLKLGLNPLNGSGGDERRE